MTVRRPLAVLALATALAVPTVIVPTALVPAAAAVPRPVTTAGPLSCAPPGTLACLQITSPRSPGKYLDVADPADPHSYLRLTEQRQDRSFWRLVADTDSVVQIRNLVTGNCVDVWRTNSYLDQWECVGQTSQRWHLVPYSLADHTYRIRQSDTGYCFTRDSEDWIYTSECAVGNTEQEWALGVDGKSPTGIRHQAVKYAMRQCDKKPDTCGWKEDLAAKTPAYLGASECVSQLAHNSGTSTNSYSRTWSQTVGWENTVGGSIRLSVETGFSLGIETKVKVAIEANYSHSWVGSETVSDTVTINLAPGEYGWVTRRPLLKKVTGTWTLDVGGQPWKMPAVIRIPAKDGTNQMLSVLDLRSGTTPPTSCRG